jgi:hypothetical protein
MRIVDKLIDRLVWTKGRKEFQQRLEEVERRVFVLPVGVAQVEVERLLADAQHYRCVEAPVDSESASRVASLGAVLREFFGRFESVEEVFGDTRLARARIGPAKNKPGLTCIGEDFEFTEIAVAPGSDEILLLWGEGPDDGAPERYPSVYHLLLMNAATQDRYTPP